MSHEKHESEAGTGSLNERAPAPIDYRGAVSVAVEGTEPWSIDRLITTRGGRWSAPEEPTIYVAADPGVALAECGRHLPTSASTVVGRLWTVRLELEGAADLRDADPALVLDQRRTRAAAAALRRRGFPGIVVPSVAFLDDRSRCNIVIFADAVGARMPEVIRSPRLVASLVALAPVRRSDRR